MNRAPYCGTSRKLVLAFDIGTTFSGAAYAFLDPREVPQIHSVTKYLDNPNVGSAKVPSILYYDRNGDFRGVGNGKGLQDDESLLQIYWWKLMLGPTELPAALKDQMSKELPMGKTIIDLLSDFMRYLFDSTKSVFISPDPNGERRWNSVSHEIELVLAHPNGWGGPQQSKLRTAAVRAGIVPDAQANARVHFVTEGEASFNFCAIHTQAGEDMKLGDKVLIVDAGCRTIDVSSYTVLENGPLRVEELFQPKCLLQGGEFVTARAREMVKEKLKTSKFNTPEDLSAFAQKFDKGLKRVFSDDTGSQYIKFGSPRDNDPKHGIKSGKLMLTGKQVSEFFEPSIQSTVDLIRENFTEILSMNSFVFLVGGFASSPWLARQLSERLSDLGLKFFKPDKHTNKAVAVGAVSFFVDRFVTGRISKFAYGTLCNVIYDPSDPEHAKREHTSYADIAGVKHLPGAFVTMLPKGTKVLESQEIYIHTHAVSEEAPVMSATTRIIKYDGNRRNPRWIDIERDEFGTLCHVVADLSAAPYTSKPGRSGMRYLWSYDVVLLVGLAELKAQIRWIDPSTGIEQSTDAAVLYDDPSEDSWNTDPRVVSDYNDFDPDF